MIIEEIRTELLQMRDETYRGFQSNLIPAVSPDTVIGVRTPELQKLAKRLSKREDISIFLLALPHAYFDENQLHALVISGITEYEACLNAVGYFLPFVDNWATCDQMSPKVFKKHRPELMEAIQQWIASDETFTVRFGVGMLMKHFLDENFDPAYPEMAAAIRSEEYYVKMMVAWYFATALAKQYDAVIPLVEQKRLDTWTHNKAIRKAVESRRITSEQKEYLRTLKMKG